MTPTRSAVKTRGLELDDLSTIERGSYLHLVTIARRCGHVAHWPKFRAELVAALTATFALNPRWIDRPQC